jgi:hypothetical protein
MEFLAPVCMFLASEENSNSMCLGCVGSTGEFAQRESWEMENKIHVALMCMERMLEEPVKVL